MDNKQNSVSRRRPDRRSRSGYRPEDDPLLGIIGALKGGEPTNIAQDKHELIADAIGRRPDADASEKSTP